VVDELILFDQGKHMPIGDLARYGKINRVHNDKQTFIFF
jgi:hypothetical protein